MNVWVLMLLAGLATFATRLSMIFLLDKLKMPDWFRRALRFVPAAVLSAIILPELATRNDALDFSLRNPQLISGVLAILVAWRTRNVLLTILAGMAALLVLQALLRFF
jgi:branched-subunit amino acid transport protein